MTSSSGLICNTSCGPSVAMKWDARGGLSTQHHWECPCSTNRVGIQCSHLSCSYSLFLQDTDVRIMGQYCAFSVKILLSCWALLVLESFPLSVRWTIYPRVPEAVLLGVGQMDLLAGTLCSPSGYSLTHRWQICSRTICSKMGPAPLSIFRPGL